MIKSSGKLTDLGTYMRDLMSRLYPINRSLAGPGNRKTLEILSEEIPLAQIEVPSQTEVFDWTVPNEWMPREAWLVDPLGQKRAVFLENNLHLVSHSESVDLSLSLKDLLPHIYSLPDQPDVIPYVTQYYERGWGFCMTDNEKRSLPDGRYQIHIDAELSPGKMTLGEVSLPGEQEKEILISTYICHPSMANDNLSGVVVAAGLYKLLEQQCDRRLTYRFIFVPETVGSLSWLNMQSEGVLDRISAGVVLTCLGYDQPFLWKNSRSNNSIVDRVARHCIGSNGSCINFDPATGSDERQYCSPGFNLPIGMLCRSYPGKFSSYHTSADTVEKIHSRTLGSSLDLVAEICRSLECNDYVYERVDPKGEPMLSKRNLYSQLSIKKAGNFDRSKEFRTHLMWVLNYCDGAHSFIDIAEMSGLGICDLAYAAEVADHAGLLRPTLGENEVNR